MTSSLLTVGDAPLKNVHFSAAFADWETPPYFFDILNKEFQFTLDVCATDATAKCARYFTPEIDGLAQSWANERVFCNPPYGNVIAKWVKKAREESENNGATVVVLIPARTDTRWWHDHVIGSGAEVRFVKGRIQFYRDKIRAINAAPFPSAIVVFRPRLTASAR